MPRDNGEDEDVIRTMQRQRDKFVVLDEIYENKNYYQIGIDNIDIGTRAAEILYEAGHRDFLFLKGIDTLTSSVQRQEGFIQTLKKKGIEMTGQRIIDGAFSPSIIYNHVSGQFEQFPPFTAVFSANDQMALAFIKAAGERGLSVPKDFSIIGVDDLDLLPYISPGLSTFRQPLQTIGALGANMLVSQINGIYIREKCVLLKSQYIERESVGTPPNRL
jgi:LacI family transcriptional regulator